MLKKAIKNQMEVFQPASPSLAGDKSSEVSELMQLAAGEREV
jgi:hypothetical protein